MRPDVDLSAVAGRRVRPDTVTALAQAMAEFGIAGRHREAMFLAQTAHESGGWYYLREIWGPTPAQLRYEGRRDLGNTQPGDGRRFCGRGFIQITGRSNYAAASKALGVDLVAQPELLESVELAARSAAWFWKSSGCNELADPGDRAAFERVTKRINGGLNGLTDRLLRWEKAQTLFVSTED